MYFQTFASMVRTLVLIMKKHDPNYQPIEWNASFTWEPYPTKIEGSIEFLPIQVLQHISVIVVIPTRGDRPVFSDFCKKQIERQTERVDEIYPVDYAPLSSQPDLTQRIKKAWLHAKEMGHTYMFIFEDDDLYSENYIEYVLNLNKEGEVMYDFLGFSSTLYYHIGNRTWKHQTHPGRSSLFCTVIRVDALNDFVWPADHYLWLDLALWNFARDTRKKVKIVDNEVICVGIKHNVGKCAGKAHKWVMENKDPDLSFLRSKTDDFHFDFYSKLKL